MQEAITMIEFSCINVFQGGNVEENWIKSLLSPGAYPDPADNVRLVQTHISWIFLAGAFAYKIKKPVDFGFLNFTTLDRRRFYCHEEVRLNSRLCPEIYLGVIPLRETSDGASFVGDGRVIDYAVKMIRLPEERMADRLLSKGELTASDVRRIATTVAEFHLRAGRSKDIDSYGSIQAIRGNWEENFQQAEAFANVTISSRDLSLIRERVEEFMTANAPLFSERVTGGFIRECDGDIHLENICLTERVCIFDCIEFNERFRCCDTAADIAFPLMDLEFSGRRDLAGIFLDEYLAVSKDTGALGLIGFYRVYRAFVRGKVESFRLKDSGIPAKEKEEAKERAIRYFRLARGYLVRERFSPSLIVICGLTGSGKSTIAEALGVELGLEVLSSDRLRKELAGVPLWQHTADNYAEGLYSPARSEETYRALAARADQLLASKQGVIVDATCKKREDRENLRRLAASYGAPFYLIAAESPEDVIRRRLDERVRQGTSVSDGRWEIYLRQRGEFEPFLESEGGLMTVDSSAPLDDTVDALLVRMGLL